MGTIGSIKPRKLNKLINCFEYSMKRFKGYSGYLIILSIGGVCLSRIHRIIGFFECQD